MSQLSTSEPGDKKFFTSSKIPDVLSADITHSFMSFTGSVDIQDEISIRDEDFQLFFET